MQFFVGRTLSHGLRKLVFNEAVGTHKVLHGGDICRDIHAFRSEEVVQLLFESGDHGVHGFLNLLLGFGDVLTLDALCIQLLVAVQKLQTGRKIVVDELPELFLLLRLLLNQFENLRGQIFQAVDLGGEFFAGDLIVDIPDLLQDAAIFVQRSLCLFCSLSRSLCRFPFLL